MFNTYKKQKEDFAFLKSKEFQRKYLDYLENFDKKDKPDKRLVSVSIFEKIDNYGMHKLLNRLRRLKEKGLFKFEFISTNLFTKKKVYISDHIDTHSMFVVANILYDDKWFDSIRIEGIHISNSEIMLTTTFRFKKNKIKNHKDMHRFVIEQTPHFKKFRFHGIYFFHKEIMEMIRIYENDLFFNLIQDLYCNCFLALEGKKSILPIEVCYFIPGYKTEYGENLKDDYGAIVYYKEKEYIFIPREEGRFRAHHYFGIFEETSPVFPKYFWLYTKEMYYRVFQNIEKKKIVQTMQKYLSSRKKGVVAKDIKWFINNIRSIEEREEMLDNVLNETVEEERWKTNETGGIEEGNFIASNYYTNNFRKNYKRNLEYLQAISATRSNAIIYFVTLVSLVVSVISTIIAIISMR